jgi:hypothetical protein
MLTGNDKKIITPVSAFTSGHTPCTLHLNLILSPFDENIAKKTKGK